MPPDGSLSRRHGDLPTPGDLGGSVACQIVRAHPRRHWRGWLLVVLIATASVGAPVGVAATEHEAELAVDHVATYRVVPDEGRVDVEFSYRFENRTTDLEFPGFFESLPVDAVDLKATSGTTELATAAGPPADGFVSWVVAFPTSLSPGGTRDVTLSWGIAAPAATDELVVAPGLVAFDAFAGGTPDAAEVALVIETPGDYEALGRRRLAVEAAQDSDRVRHRVVGADPYEIVEVGFEAPALLDRREVMDAPLITAVGATEQWMNAVAAGVPEMIPALDRWFGPRDAPLEIRERPTVGIDADHRALHAEPPAVSVPVEVTDAALAVSLSHAWLADVDSGEEWFAEGLAAAFADRLTGAGPEVDGPARVADPLVEQVGVDGVRTVVDALRAGTISYPGPVREEAVAPPSWRHILDLFENLAGADAAALFRAFVVEPADRAELDERAAARADYLALAGRAGEWILPPLLRTPMAAWEFDRFRAEQGAVSDTITTRDGLVQWSNDVGLDFGTVAETSFEAAEADMAATDEVLAAQAEALEAISEARRLVSGNRGLLAWLGLLGEDPDQELDDVVARWDAGEFEEATEDAHALSHHVEGAVGRGTLRLVVPAVIVLLAVLGGRRLAALARTRTVQPAS